MNERELCVKLDIIRERCNEKIDIDLYYRLNNRILFIYNNDIGVLNMFRDFSMNNLKKLISIMKREKLEINKIEITL